jgi:hypothetical protein
MQVHILVEYDKHGKTTLIQAYADYSDAQDQRKIMQNNYTGHAVYSVHTLHLEERKAREEGE